MPASNTFIASGGLEEKPTLFNQAEDCVVHIPLWRRALSPTTQHRWSGPSHPRLVSVHREVGAEVGGMGVGRDRGTRSATRLLLPYPTKAKVISELCYQHCVVLVTCLCFLFRESIPSFGFFYVQGECMGRGPGS